MTRVLGKVFLAASRNQRKAGWTRLSTRVHRILQLASYIDLLCVELLFEQKQTAALVHLSLICSPFARADSRLEVIDRTCTSANIPIMHTQNFHHVSSCTGTSGFSAASSGSDLSVLPISKYPTIPAMSASLSNRWFCNVKGSRLAVQIIQF